MVARNFIILFFLAIIVFSHKGFSDEVGEAKRDFKEEVAFTHEEIRATVKRSKETRSEASTIKRGFASEQAEDPELGAFLSQMKD